MDIPERDKLLLMELEYNFPEDPRPFEKIALKLGMTEDEVIAKVKKYIDKEVIKRVGMYVNFRSKGMEGALVAADIPLENLEKYRKMALGIRELTHNFIRNHPRYNVWYVIKAESKDTLDRKIENLMQEAGVRDYVILYSKRNLKLSVKYDIIRGISWSKPEGIPDKVPTAEDLGLDRELLKAMSMPLPITSRPFYEISQKFGYKEEELVDLIRELRGLHVIKDYGATLNGEKVGITENAMLLINTDNVEDSCIQIAEKLYEATHVVLRESNKPWDYLCYCMLHGKDKHVIRDAAKNAIQMTNAKSYMLLYSLENLKPGIVM
ncbi:MAG: Lrp/AsnC family transcriptional regulator [Candidatus Aramenus sp.]|jgi:DNA-binding Lrp family transcriptional regulator|nr:Lrp/AsnC family transcriptional regulator [Candidatus Aramenus sp.]